jgi:hypothetical protein
LGFYGSDEHRELYFGHRIMQHQGVRSMGMGWQNIFDEDLNPA